MSTTCKPMLDTFWFIKCKMAWKEKNQQACLDNKTSLDVRILLCQRRSVGWVRWTPLLVLPASPCWPCEPPASADGQWDLPLGETSRPKSHFRRQFWAADSQHVRWGKLSLLTLSAAEGAAVSVQRVNTPRKPSQNCHGEAQNNILLTHHLWEPPSLCGIWFRSRWPADGGEIGFYKFTGTHKISVALTSTTTTSTFTFGGKFSSGWKRFAMATSRWMVARRSLLWMTDRRLADNKIKSGESAQMGITGEASTSL